jgi:hypothetical protein
MSNVLPIGRAAIRMKKFLIPSSLGIVLVLLLLATLQCRLVASPHSTIRIVDEKGKPLIGVRVVRRWDTSEDQKGESEAVTGQQGEANFERIELSMSWLKRITKPLLIALPASCGVGWQIYGHTEFDVYRPVGYGLKFDQALWTKVNSIYRNQDGICIYDPAQLMQTNYYGIYFFNKATNFDYTLTMYKT